MNKKLDLSKDNMIRKMSGSNKVELEKPPMEIQLVRGLPLPTAETMERPIPASISTKPQPKGRPTTFTQQPLSKFGLGNS